MRYFIYIGVCLLALSSCGQKEKNVPVNDKPVVEKKSASVTENLESEGILVVSHRGDWRNAPENSLQAIQNCIDMGVDMVEIDLKKTKDGHLVLMHDKTINRTMNGKGKPEDYTLAELREFFLKGGHGQKTRHKIPTFEEVMMLCKGKIMVNVDKGYDYFKDAYAVLEKTGTVGQCVMKSDYPYEKVKAENGEVLDKMVFMPVVNLHKEGAEAIIDGYLKNMQPKAFELVFNNDSADVLRLIKKVKDSGAKIFINSLWPDLCGGHDDDRAVELKEPEESWGWIINQGAKLIQTDRPAFLLDYLRNKGLHQ